MHNVGNDCTLEGFDAQIKTDRKAQLLSTILWLPFSA